MLRRLLFFFVGLNLQCKCEKTLKYLEHVADSNYVVQYLEFWYSQRDLLRVPSISVFINLQSTITKFNLKQNCLRFLRYTEEDRDKMKGYLNLFLRTPIAGFFASF